MSLRGFFQEVREQLPVSYRWALSHANYSLGQQVWSQVFHNDVYSLCQFVRTALNGSWLLIFNSTSALPFLLFLACFIPPFLGSGTVQSPYHPKIIIKASKNPVLKHILHLPANENPCHSWDHHVSLSKGTASSSQVLAEKCLVRFSKI